MHKNKGGKNEKMKALKKVTGILLSMSLVCAIMVSLTGCAAAKRLDVSIAGKKVELDDTVQSLYDNGLCVCEIMGEKQKQLDDLGTIPGRTYEIESYSIGVPDGETKADYSGVCVYLYNDSGSEKPISECKIYHMVFLDVDDEVEVTIEGKDLFHMEPQEAYDACTAMGIDFASDDKEDIDEFLEGDGHLFSKQGNLSYGMTASKDGEEVSLEFEYEEKLNK